MLLDKALHLFSCSCSFFFTFLFFVLFWASLKSPVTHANRTYGTCQYVCHPTGAAFTSTAEYLLETVFPANVHLTPGMAWALWTSCWRKSPSEHRTGLRWGPAQTGCCILCSKPTFVTLTSADRLYRCSWFCRPSSGPLSKLSSSSVLWLPPNTP